MTREELGMPPPFEEAMKRRLGRSGIIVEVGGKYYLSEERLKQVEERFASRDGGGAFKGMRNNILALRIGRMFLAVLLVILIAVNVFVRSLPITLTVVGLLVVWVALTLVQIFYFSKVRKRFQPLQPTQLQFEHLKQATMAPFLSITCQ